MARRHVRKKRESKWQRHFGHVAHICSERARKGIEPFKECMSRMLKK